VALVGLLLSSPYLAWTTRHLLAKVSLPEEVSLDLLIVLQMLQTAVITAGLAFAGVVAAEKAGLRAPLLEALAAGRRPAPERGFLVRSLVFGTIAWVLILGVLLSFRSALPAAFSSGASEPDRLVVRLTGLFYGGLVEETWVRWAIMSALALGLSKLVGQGARAFWIANVAAALIFGALHLPAAAGFAGGQLTPAVVTYVFLGNGAGAVIYGWLFQRHGLETAMLAHAVTDVWLHGLQPLMGI
jgi:membrane protease YdiL (CAAX protease family)